MTAAAEGLAAGLEAHARQLAQTHVLAARRHGRRRTCTRVPDYAAWIARIRTRLEDAGPELAKAAEWLLDNEYLIARATRQVREDLTPEFRDRLPRLGGTLAGQLRVGCVADALLEAARLQLSLSTACQFVAAYQERAPLTIAELWAFPIFIRLHCLNALVAASVELDPALRPAFPIERTDDMGLEATERVGRAVSALHAAAAIPWKDFFCRTSRVEAILGEDPGGVYASMDFDTRDRYRKAVEEIADTSRSSEVEIADRVVAFARQWVGRSARCAHVGYWLVDAGRDEIERTFGCRLSQTERLRRWALRHAAPLYTAAIAIATLTALALPVVYLMTLGAGPGTLLLALCLAGLPATTLAVTIVHWAITNAFPPRTLPKLDFEAGVPDEHRTAVVVPTLIANADDAVRQMGQLEIHYLANPDRMAQFVLLGDFLDAPAEQQPEDHAILTALSAEVRRLNAKYPSQPFHVLHRRRRFNASEGVWMGWERKRGKLDEFNHLLCGLPVDSFILREGHPEGLTRVRYVVTLDADTMLPRGALARLIGTLAHPLNRPEFDEGSGRVRAGYTVIQPRVEILPEVGSRSALARWFTGDTAIDIYSHAVSDVYQDLFGSGIYVGKGAYDVDAFRRSLEHRVPENALLSHDLFEGLHGRVGLATDIVLYEGFPTHYVEFARRSHRWIRGDWQLLPWLWPTVPGPNGTRLRNRFGLIDRWKIVDNLRRSLLAPGMLAMLAAAWLVLPGHPALWTLLACAAPGGHLFSDLVTGFARGRRRTAITAPFQRLTDQAGRWALLLLFLPFDAVVAMDAVVRTLVRLVWTRRHLLEWTSAAHAARAVAATDGRAFVWRAMIAAPLCALGLGAALAWWRPGVLPIALPFLVTWSVAPEVAYRLGRPRRRGRPSLTAADRDLLRRIARRTWLYFEVFAGPDDHWLPPDNYQESPRGEVAHRTSPTNIGMMLVSSVAAYDLGYAGALELTTRIRATLETLDRLERYKGHFFNWYHTRTLEPLLPRYVSTVDSGNLACALLLLKQTCHALADAPLLSPQRPNGARDILLLLTEALDRLPGSPALRATVRKMLAQVEAATRAPEHWPALARALRDRDLPQLDTLIRTELGASNPPPEIARVRAVRVWLERLHHDLRSCVRDEDALCPWRAVLQEPPDACRPLAERIGAMLPPATPLSRAAELCRQAGDMATAAPAAAGPEAAWIASLAQALERGRQAAVSLLQDLASVAARADALAMAMDFHWLFDSETRLLHLGYNVSADRVDPHHYDLLASEARLASLFAIAKGDVPVEHWFHLGRPITSVDGQRCLISWGGSMFEYLMPSIFVRSEPGTLLDVSERVAVTVHARYARRRNIPWGMSESAVAATDADHVYQYQSFGVPTLRFRRSPADDLVVAPYATALAALADLDAAVENCRRLHALDTIGEYGCYEAIDFTPARRPPGRAYVVVRSYMAHHQGMILAALDNVLRDDVLRRRMSADARLRAVSLLLHERVPREAPREAVGAHLPARMPQPVSQVVAPWTPTRAGAFPEMLFLGNGRLASWISDSGSGVLRWREWSVTGWIPDAVRDECGIWLYIRDNETGAVWSATRQPMGAAPEAVDVVFYPHVAEFHRRDHGLAIRLEVGVAAADDVELRRLTIINDGPGTRRLTVSSYGEIALADAASHERHPAFSKLFVCSEPVPSMHGLLFERRPRSPAERPPVVLHWVISDDAAVTPEGADSDRRAFLGRCRTTRDPIALEQARQTPAGTTGFTLDPVMSLRVSIVVPPGGTARCVFATGVATSRESVLALGARFQTMSAVEWALADAAGETARELARLGVRAEAVDATQRLGSLLLYPQRALRKPEALVRNQGGQSALWGLGLSGDLPIIVVRIGAMNETALVNDLIGAMGFLRRRQLASDLVALHEGASSYEQPLAHELRQRMQAVGWPDQLGRRAGVHLLHTDRLDAHLRDLVEAAASVVLDASLGDLSAQLAAAHAVPVPLPPFTPAREASDTPATVPSLERPKDLQFDNGFGGFSADGREYIVTLGNGEATPAPWSNVLANAAFGTLVTEGGLGFTWCGNSAERRLTPWTNDPVTDPSGEAIYVRDEETAEIWSLTPRPAPSGAPYHVHHGVGYTSWRSRCHDLEHTLTVFVPPDEPVKIARLHIRNGADRPRRLTVTYFAEWILGSGRRPAVLLVPEYDAAAGALLARNPWPSEFGTRVAFLASDRLPHGVTADRTEFLGREQPASRPAALQRWGLSGRVQAGDDPCAALQVHLDLAPAGEADVAFLLGEAPDRPTAASLITRYRSAGAIEAAWTSLRAFWDARLGVVQVETPDPAANLLLNRWLLYQALSARILARTGFYQSSGAIGFRDQLQDVLAFVLVEPARCRAHLLECAAHQFEEGDVLHWWHPPSGRGVRTRCSDDLLWLPFAVAHYVLATGDHQVLDERVPFLRGRPLAPQEDDLYALFDRSDQVASLFEHCERALERGVTRGPHGLPLIGAGDWNDGMNRVGRQGRGESVWLACFAVFTLHQFARVCRLRNASDLAERWTRRAREIEHAVEDAAWDGNWYCRAFDDEGRPWGSHASEECRIDSLAQSWAVMAGVAAPARATRAMQAVEAQLIDRDKRLVRLLTPPFARTLRDPGYIKAYPPGVRENGGQYTHAAVWVGWAYADLGDADAALRVFDLLNPIHHARTPEAAERYRVEPYVLAADVYDGDPYAGRGGWTWYTGSAAWLWRFAIERVIGLRLDEGRLRIEPCLPTSWPSVRVRLRTPGGTLRISIEHAPQVEGGTPECRMDGEPLTACDVIALPTDGREHEVLVRVPLDRPAAAIASS